MLMKKQETANEPLISVCIAVYNAEEYLNECIDSIMNQTFRDFELLLIDDGSTDHSVDIVRAYHDSRIRLLISNHDYISTLNLLLTEARGKYIARMDADDRMIQDRLLWQYEYMEAHPEVDGLGGGLRLFGDSVEIWIPPKCYCPLGVLDMMHGTPVAQATMMIRRDVIKKHRLRYEKDYILAEDYRLWVRMIQLNLHIENLPEVLHEYRISDKQISFRHKEKQKEIARRVRKELEEWIVQKEQPYTLDTLAPLPLSGNQLTIIITFLNEGEEVINTVCSIRQFVGNTVDIIVINDHSYDGYDYYHQLLPYRVHYFYNKERKGVAASRDVGVCLCSTPYFLLLDAHMRFYEGKWVDSLVRLLEENDRCVLCCQTKALNKDNLGNVFERRNVPPAYGAYIPFMKNKYLPDIRWKNKECYPGENIEPVPAVLGAGYAASKRYWQYLRGLEGLLLYGCDEAYLSLKVWLEGGQCLLVKDVVIGHIYRQASPYEVPTEKFVYNYLFVSSLLFPAPLRILSFAIAQCINRKSFDEAIQLLSQKSAQITELKEYYNNIFTKPFEEIVNLNRFLDVDQEKDILQKRDILPEIADFLFQKPMPSDVGIIEGVMSEVLFFFHYARFTHEEQWQEHAYSLLNKILVVDAEKLSVDFEKGLSGIGWGLLYLQEQGFIDEEMVEPYLLQIDSLVMSIPIGNIDTLSFTQGAGGVMWYWITRFLHSDEQNKRKLFERNFIVWMHAKAEEMLQHSNDLFVVNAALQFKYIRKYKTELETFRYVPSLHDWMNFPSFLPKNPNYWKPGMAGCTGVGLLTMLVLTSNK